MIETNKLPSELAGGFCECLKINGRIIKTVQAGNSLERASQIYAKLRTEYLCIKAYLGEYALDTKFEVVNRNGNFVVNLDQLYIEGTPLRTQLNPNNEKQKDFLTRCLNLYDNENIIPDLIPDIMPDPTGGIYLTQKYCYRSGPNVILKSDNSPILVDTILNRSLSNGNTSAVVKKLVVSRIRSLLI